MLSDGYEGITDVTMKPRRLLCISSLKELFLTILVVATASVFLTYYTSHLLPYSNKEDFNLLLQGDGNYDDIQNANRRNLESVRDLEEASRMKGHHRLKPSQLLKTLSQIEQKLKFSNISKIFILYKDSDSTESAIKNYEQAFNKAGLMGKVSEITANKMSLKELLSEVEVTSGNHVVYFVCLSVSICHPLEKLYGNNIMVNYIPSLGQYLGSRESFCRTMNTLNSIPAFRESNLSPACYVLPEQATDLLTYINKHSPAVRWLLKSIHSDAEQAIDSAQLQNLDLIYKLYHKETALLQQDVDQSSVEYSMPATVTAYILITSTHPLRMYLYNTVILDVKHDQNSLYSKIPDSSWTYKHLWDYLRDLYGVNVARTVFTNTQTAITKTILASILLSARDYSHRYTFYSHLLLAVDLKFSSNPYSAIGITKMKAVEDEILCPPGLIDSLVSMVTSKSSASQSVTSIVQQHFPYLTLQTHCDWDDQYCVHYSHIQYLLSTQRELQANTNFELLYPRNDDSSKYTSFLHNLQLGIPNSNINDVILPPLLQQIISFLNRPQANKVTKITKGVFKPLLQPATLQRNNIIYRDFFKRPKCTNDESAMPHLSRIVTNPNLTLSPAFDPAVYDYYTTVSYHVLVVTLWAFAQNCNCEARLSLKYSFSRPSNFTLGLGENLLKILVVDISHTDPWVLSTYTIHVHRKDQPSSVVNFDPGGKFHACSLKQSCDLKFLPDEGCGLLPTKFHSWFHLQNHTQTLPACSTGDEQGSWLVPCLSCDREDSCHWSSALWQPHSCSHKHIPRTQLKTCLKHKQVLFIGDSTNRGIMNYLVEQVNGSLAEWDKTHNIKVYNNVNNGKTTVSFAYYPQFWLPANQRPAFEKAFYQIVKRLGSLENSRNSVIVIGGVHWLGVHHLNILKDILIREGLTDVQVIVKGLGAGFHQRVDEIQHLFLKEHKRLLYTNVALMDSAKRLGYDVVDTFNVTMARYKDFLQGKCACHFHRVREILPSFTELQKRLSKGGRYKPVDIPVQYHVEGDINAAYAEILINRICS